MESSPVLLTEITPRLLCPFHFVPLARTDLRPRFGLAFLIDPKEIDELKLEAKHTIDMARFVDEDEIDTRYWEKPYYLLPDGDEADEGYAIMQRALAETSKVAIGQLIMGGRAHLVGIKALNGGLMLSILRYADELRDPKSYFERINAEPNREAVGLAKELIEAETGRFEPEKIPDKYAEALHELLRAKVEQRAPQIEVATEGKAPKEVINIMAALKESMQAKGRAKVRDAVRRRMGKPEKEEKPTPRTSRLRPSCAGLPIEVRLEMAVCYEASHDQ
jgi:DNA end-binding protein Ku